MDQVRWMFETEADAAREQRSRRTLIVCAWLLMVAGGVLLLSLV